MIKLKDIIIENTTKIFEENKEWIVHCGNNIDKNSKVSVIFTESKTIDKIWFEVNYNGVCKNDGNNRENMSKWANKASRTWSKIAKDKYNNPELNEVGNPIKKSWEECFMEAINSEELKPYIKNYKIEKKNNNSPVIMDPVNFTPRIQ
jgi:hypothetical protein